MHTNHFDAKACSNLTAPSGAIRYLHVPKAGSSFAPVVWSAACPLADAHDLELHFLQSRGPQRQTNLSLVTGASREGRCPCYWGGVFEHYHHLPLLHEDVVSATAGLFREPSARIRSAADANFHMHGSSASQHAALKTAMRQATSAQRTFLFAIWPGVSQVQAKLLLGVAASDPRVVRRAAQVAAAVDRVRRMAFVGLTECFDESARLFRLRFLRNHSNASNAATPHFRPSKMTPAASNSSEPIDVRAKLLGADFRDPADDCVYRAAIDRFHRERRSHGVPIVSRECNATLDCKVTAVRKATSHRRRWTIS